MTCSNQKTVLVKDFRRGERFNNQIQKSWWKVFRSLELESFIIWNGTSQIISKNTKTPFPRKKTSSLIQNNEILKKLKTNDP